MTIKGSIHNLYKIAKRLWASFKEEQTDYNDAYSLDIDIADVSKEAFASAKLIRGSNNQPALMLYGVAPRSGTNYVANVLANHPDIVAYPNEIYEIPFLRLTNKLNDFQTAFFKDYHRNIQHMQKNDFLPLFGASFLAHLFSFVPDNKVMLVKEPDVRFLRYFPLVFPNENLLLILRDGRDVVHSTINTWPSMNFKKVCQRWSDSCILILNFHEKNKEKYLLVKYEDILENPKSELTKILRHYKLNVDTYPFEKIESMPIIGSSTASKNNNDKVNWDPVASTKTFKPTGKWNTWTARQKEDFKNIAGDTLIKTDYCNNLDW